MNNRIDNREIVSMAAIIVLTVLFILFAGDWARIQAQKDASRGDTASANPPLTQPAPFDFDGDTKTDIAIYRYLQGEWWNLNSASGGNSAAQFGNAGFNDFPVPADFTGDGKTDHAFYRQSSNEWFVLRSEDQSYYSFPFGSGEDQALVGDFDGDRRADAAVYRKPEDPNGLATFYINLSSGGVRIEQFGTIYDTPMIGDYDGDGKDDLAIYRFNRAEWWIKDSSTGNVRVYTFGIPGVALRFGNVRDSGFGGGLYSVPVPADYTGDGKTDVAYYSSQGDWYVLRSEDGSYYSFPFGSDDDYPIIGDYDGDGIADPGVVRNGTALTWYMLQSTDGFKAVTFGLEEDLPISVFRIGVL